MRQQVGWAHGEKSRVWYVWWLNLMHRHEAGCHPQSCRTAFPAPWALGCGRAAPLQLGYVWHLLSHAQREPGHHPCRLLFGEAIREVSPSACKLFMICDLPLVSIWRTTTLYCNLWWCNWKNHEKHHICWPVVKSSWICFVYHMSNRNLLLAATESTWMSVLGVCSCVLAPGQGGLFLFKKAASKSL